MIRSIAFSKPVGVTITLHAFAFAIVSMSLMAFTGFEFGRLTISSAFS